MLWSCFTRRVTVMIANIISCYCAHLGVWEGRQWEPAVALLHKMLRAGMTDNVISFIMAISAREKACIDVVSHWGGVKSSMKLFH